MLEWLFPILYPIVVVNNTTPCFENYINFTEIFQTCMGTDYIKGTLTGWEWVTGGWFSMILVSILIGITYIHYHKVIYPLIIGSLFIPIAYVLFPTQFLVFALIFGAFGACCLLWFIFISQTNET